MDPDLLAFLKRYVDSFVKWDLIAFFHNNPHTMDTVENIARYAAREPSAIGEELMELAAHHLLDEAHVGDLVVYSLTQDPQLRKQIAHFVTASEDRQFRIRAIYYVINDPGTE
jgi:hypothetical protein